MTPHDVLKLPILRVGDFREACNSHDWVGFPDNFLWSKSFPDFAKLATVHVRGEIIVDHRRFYRVGTVAWEYSPCVVFRMAGREGDDSWDRWVFNEGIYQRMVLAAYKFAGIEEEFPAVGMHEDIGDVMTFYGETVKPGEKHRVMPY